MYHIIHFKQWEQIYFTGMGKTLYWWWIITPDGKLRNYMTDAATTIKKIKNVFSRIGISEITRSDNDPQYNSREFEKFANDQGFQHIPQANGLAYKTVQTAKNLLQKTQEDTKDPYLPILEARNTPVDNYKSPAKLASRRQLPSIPKRQLPVNPSNLTVTTLYPDPK